MFNRKHEDDPGTDWPEPDEAPKGSGGSSFTPTPLKTDAPWITQTTSAAPVSELAEMIKAVMTVPTGFPHPAPRVTVVAFYAKGSPVVAKIEDDPTGSLVARNVMDVLRHTTGAPEASEEPMEPDPDQVREIQLSVLRDAAYAVGHPDGSEAWKPHRVIENLMTEIQNGERR